MKDFRSWLKEHKRAVAIIFSLAVLLRTVLFVVDLHSHGNDIRNIVGGAPATQSELVAHDASIAGDCYYETSRNLWAGNGFSCQLLPPYEDYQYGVPLYPMFLAFFLAFTHSYYVVILIQILLVSATCILGMYTAHILVPSAKASTFVGIFLALAPTHLSTPLNFSSEVLFMPVFFVSIILFARYLTTRQTRDLLWAGFILGLSVLIKPTAQYLPFILIVFVLWNQRHSLNKKLFGTLGCFLAVFILALSPWLLNNYLKFNVVSVSTQSTRVLYSNLLPSVIALDQGIGFAEAQAPLLKAHSDNFTFANSVGMTRYTLSELARYPVADVKMALLSATTFFTADGMASMLQGAGIKPSLHLDKPATTLLFTSPVLALKLVMGYLNSSVAFILFARILFMLISALFLVGLYAAYRTKKADAVFTFAVLLVFYFMLTTMSNGLAVTSRFRMPIEALILAIAYAGFFFIQGKWGRRQSVLTQVS